MNVQHESIDSRFLIGAVWRRNNLHIVSTVHVTYEFMSSMLSVICTNLDEDLTP